ncbi:murein biosynthesis integral membrane protein MurJ [Legionella sp. W05-934-2]|jgi:putative peptidoglycan lipid II flippase|uniref:murein biosynthesis integral membrane protein MurJ n=1 Tax=Legionella sp. W05-934-2 TaxID=1198649 RepID=UPI0034623108
MTVSKTLVNPKQSLVRSTSIVSLFTFLSRILGFVRDMVIAHFFGAQAGVDAFFVAFRIPNFMRRLFAEGAFSQAFVPVLAEYQQTQPIQDVRLFIGRIAGSLASVLTLVTLVGVVAAPIIVMLFAPGFEFDNGRAELTTHMLRITFPYLMLISLTALAGAILNTYGYFAIPALTPIILNFSLIFSAVYLTSYTSPPVVALAWGVLIAGCAQFLFQIPFLKQRNLLVRPFIHWGDPGVRRVLKLMVPALFGVSVAQINLLIDTIFASFLPVGSVSWLYYTDRLTDFPLGVFGVAVATVILPHLSRKRANQDPLAFSRSLDWGIRMILLVGVPAFVGLAFFSMPLIASCFAYGKFTQLDVIQTQKSLIALSLGVPPFMLVKVLASGFYSGQDIKTPVKAGVYAMIVNSLLCAALIFPLKHAGLALASALAGYVNAGLLMYWLIRRKIYHPSAGWLKYALQLIVANLVISGYLYWQMGNLAKWLALSPIFRLSYLLAQVMVTLLIYLVALFVLGLRYKQFKGRQS